MRLPEPCPTRLISLEGKINGKTSPFLLSLIPACLQRLWIWNSQWSDDHGVKNISAATYVFNRSLSWRVAGSKPEFWIILRASIYLYIYFFYTVAMENGWFEGKHLMYFLFQYEVWHRQARCCYDWFPSKLIEKMSLCFFLIGSTRALATCGGNIDNLCNLQLILGDGFNFFMFTPT